MRIAMIGSGYVGLVSGACLADFGHVVTCVDADETRIAALLRGEVPIYEPGLDSLIAATVAAGRLCFSTDLADAVAGADIVFVAVGTPSRRGDGHADLTYVHAAAAQIAAALRGFTVVVTKSTVPVGTGDEVERIIRAVNPQADVAVVANPEFLREGAAIEDFRNPDRIVIGIEDERARGPMTALYDGVPAATPRLFTSRRGAELTKYAANAFLAMKVSFINEIADLCEALGTSVDEVAHGIGLDARIGAAFLKAGPGYGGSCFPKDTLALARTARDAERPLSLVEAAMAFNDRRPAAMAHKIVAASGGDVRGRHIAVLGLTFKAGTDDMREAPSLGIVAALEAAGAHVSAFDPKGMDAAASLLPRTRFAATPYEAARDADALAIVTEWEEFRRLDFGRLRALMRRPVLVDLRNLFSPAEIEAHGFAYVGIGRPGEAAKGPAP